MEPLRRLHQAYTLRLSRVAETDVWRITLYCAQTGQRHHFLSVAQLYAYLLQETGEKELERDPPDPEQTSS